MLYFCGISLMSRVRKMPLPWLLAEGFTIHCFWGSLYMAACNSKSSFGRIKVNGMKP